MVTISESSQEVKDPVHLVFFFCEQMFLSCEILNFRFQEQQDKLCAILCIWAMFLIHRMLSPCLHNVKIKCMVWFIEIRLTASRLPEHARCSAGVHNGGLICEGVVNSGVFSWPVFSTFAISNLCTKLMKIREMKVT